MPAVSAQNLQYVGETQTSGSMTEIQIAGNYIYAANYGLQVFDVSDPSSPFLVGDYDSLNYCPGIFVQDNYAYVSAGLAGLQILNVQDPERPYFESYYNPPGVDIDYDVYVKGSYAYLADDGGGLQIVNINDPSNPYLSGQLKPLGIVSNIFLQGNYAYLVDYINDSLLVINISNPENPIYSGSCSTFESPYTVVISGSYAFIGTQYYLQIFDIGDPSHPEEVSNCTLPQPATGIAIADNYVFAAVLYSGIRVIDIADINNPAIIAGYQTRLHAIDVIINGDMVYVSEYNPFPDSSSSILLVLRFDPTSINNDSPMPKDFSLSPNYPNPFNASTSISYSLAKSGSVNLSIYNLLGQKVAILSDGIQQAGKHSVIWNAKDCPSGVYFAKLEAEEQTKNIKMVLLK